MIDSHCHLADKKFSRDLDQVIKRAKDAGVDRIVTISDTIQESQKSLEIAKKYDNVFCTVGVHPHGARFWDMSRDEQLLRQYFAHEKVVGIGEIGLDYHYPSAALRAGYHSPRDVQRDVFKAQLELARDLSAPAVIHCREAIEDVKRIMHSVKHNKMVVHCCTEKWKDVQDLVESGVLLGFTGIATYPQAEAILDVIKNCPLEQMMIETDAPYLAPVPHRGKRNEPAFVVEVAKIIADIKEVSIDEVDRVTTQNTVEFYNLS